MVKTKKNNNNSKEKNNNNSKEKNNNNSKEKNNNNSKEKKTIAWAFGEGHRKSQNYYYYMINSNK
jgi:hypothetical protein